MDEPVPATPQALDEALRLSEEILGDIELSRVPLSSAVLKSARLARLLNDFDMQQVFEAEASGYPSGPGGLSPEIWALAEMAGRVYQEADKESGESKHFAYLESVDELEVRIASGKIALEAATDRDLSISSANPHQIVSPPLGNVVERTARLDLISKSTSRLASRRAFTYGYVFRKYYQLKFSAEAQDVFSTVREAVDGRIGDAVPSAVQKFASVHENLESSNPEDWSNAVHSCRRILQDLADAVFPPGGDRTLPGGKSIKLGPDNYVNRLMCFAEDNTDSERFVELVGSHLAFLGDRLDAVFQAAQKGSHSSVSQAEARRYVIYTYMLVADLLSLKK